jgi:bis(5'-nucleosyl)-tetraphosphatase (symmetrical)
VAVYAIGDVQGCYDELRLLLDKIAFDPTRDRVCFVGDLVNRGPRSLETLRFIQRLGAAAVAVLGNHDLHLLAVACGISRTKHKDTFGDILNAPDRDALLDWLRRRPLMHREGEFYLIHAGLPPQWGLQTALDCAREVETVLREGDYRGLFATMYGDLPDLWQDTLQGWERLRYITNCFTRIRYVDAQGRLNLKEKRAPQQAAAGLWPWHQAPERRSQGAKIIFGHWSTLGLHSENHCVCLDTGCLWGGELTALRLDQAAPPISVSSLGGIRLLGD